MKEEEWTFGQTMVEQTPDCGLRGIDHDSLQSLLDTAESMGWGEVYRDTGREILIRREGREGYDMIDASEEDML